jgi:hypothetical protein
MFKFLFRRIKAAKSSIAAVPKPPERESMGGAPSLTINVAEMFMYGGHGPSKELWDEAEKVGIRLFY